jgi:hypothetical protein
MTSKYRTQIEYAAAVHRVDSRIIEAMVFQESSDHPYAYNPEPEYRYFWNVKTWAPFRRPTPAELASQSPPKDFPALGGDPDQEWWSQQASHGLMQIMGALARELGFRGIFLPEINDVHLNLDLGCRYFAQLMRWAKSDTWKAVAAYNGGRGNWNGAAPQAHAAKVRRIHGRIA